MNTYSKILSAALLCVTLASCESSLPSTKDPKVNIAYLEEAVASSTLRFTVSDDGGSTVITPRIANRIEQEVSLAVEVDKDILDKYNKDNKSNYKLLPQACYDLVCGDQKGKALDLKLAPMEYGKAVAVKVNTMRNADGTLVPLTENYAIPVRLKSVSGGSVQLKSSDNVAIIFLDRKFKTSVLKIHGRMLCEVADPKNDKEYTEWTAQYSFCPFEVNSNVGLMYPNTRESNDSPLYMSLSGGGFLLHANTGGGGKINFNQPKFDNFKFETGKWYHMAIVYKEENSKPMLRIYVNGELALENVWPGKVSKWPKIYIGNANFNSLVRELRFWERALTLSEVNSTLYFADPKAKGLELYMPFDKENKTKNITEGKADWYKVSFNSGATDKNINFDEEVIFPN
ncbi:DUF1735 and LamG domain-containing protein [Porphyromonas pogonae]|uniref:DUF1735 and LamG domain-containing protein n=1 Tax=Porphyromonas pogonae TaxID=867595 RepID=UPI002E7A1190|nr:DUF1735 and LamG domain-containing protein [Porphyromonas pogonae]